MKKEDLRIVFMGTPEFAVESLKALCEGGYNVVAVVTQPDRPVGRHGSVLQPSAVKTYALEQGLPVLQPEKMKDEAFQALLRSYNADLQVVVAFRMLPQSVWAMPRFGTFNVHAALLPQYRGAAPINWAIINGETETGVTTFFLDENIDTGRVIMQKRLAIGEEDNVEKVYDQLMVLGAQACTETIDKILETDGNVESIPQEQLIKDLTKGRVSAGTAAGGTTADSADNSAPSGLKASLADVSKSFLAPVSEVSPEGVPLFGAPKLFKENCRIDFNRSAKQVHDFIRGLSPVPGAWCMLHNGNDEGKVLKIYDSRVEEGSANAAPGTILPGSDFKVCCGEGVLRLTEVQLAGKKRMSAKDFKNGQSADFVG